MPFNRGDLSRLSRHAHRRHQNDPLHSLLETVVVLGSSKESKQDGLFGRPRWQVIRTMQGTAHCLVSGADAT